ncbi:MAG: phosphoadenosine phosphosulfate reductase family protein [Methanomassiliicoccales archaeon]|nr:phosphoadenosine phosphosulfate reductase family protein [Methanomassiliicoccales archaeon]
MSLIEKAMRNSKKVTSFRHGKVVFKWCDECATLVLGDECAICGSVGRPFSVTAPGDLRPCLQADTELLKRIFYTYFGVPDFLDGVQIFLNKIPGEDRADEIVVDGRVIGVLLFDIVSDDFRLELRIDGARALADIAKKGVVEIDMPRGHLKGKNIPGTMIKRARGTFNANDPLIVLAGDFICSSIARVPSDQVKNSERAIGIRDVGRGRLRIAGKKRCWSRFVEANISYFKTLEAKAVSDVKSYLNSKKDMPVTLSFSGGKDSLACFGILEKASKKFSMIFVNTGLEFPETTEYVRRFAEKRGFELLIADANNGFWNNVDFFGPPSKDFRWCCKVCKLGPLTALIEDRFPKGTITIEGNRTFESFARAHIAFVENNPFVPNQIILNPIREWRSVDVWGYIWWKNLEYNPLYENEYERIGCYLCPACLASEWKRTKMLHPKLSSQWEKYLYAWASKMNMPEEFVKYGFWRWKVLPKKMRRLAADIKISIPTVRTDCIQMKMVKGATPCVAGGFSLEGVVMIPRKRSFAKIAEMMKTIGPVRYSDEYEIAMVKTKDGTIKVFGGGQIVVTSSTPDTTDELFELAVKALLRSQLCTECGICVKNCQRKAIKLNDGPMILEERCSHCGKCTDACVIAHYYDKLVSR